MPNLLDPTTEARERSPQSWEDAGEKLIENPDLATESPETNLKDAPPEVEEELIKEAVKRKTVFDSDVACGPG